MCYYMHLMIMLISKIVMINKLKTNPKFSSDIATSNRFMNRMAMITFFQTKTTISFQITFL